MLFIILLGCTDIHIHIQIILTINLSEYVLNKPSKPTHKHRGGFRGGGCRGQGALAKALPPPLGPF